MRPQLYRITAAALLIAGALSAGCCGPMMFHGGCRSGCGELYIDPWINDPADCCDPCDSCGNFNGQTCAKCPNILTGAKSIWGYRYEGGCDGCDSCGGMDTAGLEPACGCESPAVCDCAIEPACGLEPSCGIEGCGGCTTCGGNRQFVEHPFVPGESVMEPYDLEASRVIVPGSQRVFRGRNVASGPSVEYR